MNKKKIAIAILALSLSAQIGCTKVNDQDSDKNLGNNKLEQEQNIKIDEEKVLAEFNEIVDDNEKLSEAVRFLDNNVSKVSKETASQMVMIFEEAQDNYLATIEDKYFNEEIQEKLQSLNKSIEEINEMKDINDDTIKELIAETKSIGYKVETAEGSYFPIIDYSFFKKYSSYVTDDMKEYIQIMAIESDRLPAKDAELTITWDEILNRALRQEKFIKEYKDSSRVTAVKDLYSKYVFFIFNGVDNTPLFAYPSNTMSTEAKSSYLAAIENVDHSDLLKELSEFMKTLKESEYKLTDNVQKYREEATKRLTDNK